MKQNYFNDEEILILQIVLREALFSYQGYLKMYNNPFFMESYKICKVDYLDFLNKKIKEYKKLLLKIEKITPRENIRNEDKAC